MRAIQILSILLLSGYLFAVEVGPYKVNKVVDGDTIKIKTDLGERTVRMIYIDTAESKDNTHGKAMPEGIKAKEFLTKWLQNRQVKLWGPGDEIEQDRYGRLYMPNNPNKVTTEELALTNMVQIEAVTRLGIEKGLWTREEFAESIQKVTREFQNRRGEKN